MNLRRVGSLALACSLCVALAPARATADAPFRVENGAMKDASGRWRAFHGVNAVWKRAPYYPPSSIYPAPYGVDRSQSYFDERDAALLVSHGFNLVRLGVIWKALEPQRDSFDEAYLDRIEDIVDMLGRFGIAVLLDFHQDMYNERFEGEGFPDWATRNEVPPTNCCGFPGNYFTPAVARAFDNLWLNTDALWDEYRDAWAHVASRFAGTPNLLGYDLFNEPFPGSQLGTCASPAGCPAFDAGVMQPFYEHVIAGIRARDDASIIWWEPNLTNDFGAANGVGLVTALADPAQRLGLSFHAYCLLGGQFVPGLTREADPECPVGEELTFDAQHAAAARNHSAMLLSEFGASDELGDIARVLRFAGPEMSWAYWHYGHWGEPTGVPTQGMFADDLDRASIKQAKLALLRTTYPQAIAGLPIVLDEDPADGYTMRYAADQAIDASRHPTELYVAPEEFPDAQVIVTGGHEIACPQPRAGVRCIAHTDHVVEVTIR